MHTHKLITKHIWLLTALLIGILVLLVPSKVSSTIFVTPTQPSVLEAPAQPHAPMAPPQLFTPYGVVKVNGSDVEAGTLIGGWCAGTQADEEPAQLADFEGSLQSLYALEIPDALCPSGFPITFTINGLVADQGTTWVEGGARVDLTSTFAMSLTNQVSMDGITWHDSDTAESAVMTSVGSTLQWRFAVTNTSAVTVNLYMTSTVDGGGTRLLEEYCVPQLPAELSPAGLPGASAACQFGDTVPAGSNSNMLTATIHNGLWTSSAVDPAYSFGYQMGLEVNKSVSDGLTWFDADTPPAYPELTVDDELLWRITVTNTSNITASLVMTDVLDEATLNLATACAVPPPSTLEPWGSVGDAFTCLISDIVSLSTHSNAFTATMHYGDSALTDMDTAGYVGIPIQIQLGLILNKRVSDGAVWFDADTPATYPELTVDDELLWQIAVTNTSEVMVSLIMTDHFDTTTLNLATACVVPPPSTLGPWGSVGDAYTCLISDTISLSTHRNAITVTVRYGDSVLTDMDTAGYVGIPAQFKIYLPVVLR